MRRASVNDTLVAEDRQRVAALDPGERIALALRLGEESLALYCAAEGIDRETARKRIERARQAQRRPCGCIEALLR